MRGFSMVVALDRSIRVSVRRREHDSGVINFDEVLRNTFPGE